MLACVLRPSDRAPASVVGALIRRLPVPLRRAWLKTKIVVRANSDLCRPGVLQRRERWGVHYMIRLQKNLRLKQQVDLAELALAEQYAVKQTKPRMFGRFTYAAKTWGKERRVIGRLGGTAKPQRGAFVARRACRSQLRLCSRDIVEISGLALSGSALTPRGLVHTLPYRYTDRCSL